MQMTLIIITGYAVATSPPVFRIICRIALIPKDGPSAAAFVGLFSMMTSLLSWSFSLIFSGLLAREVAHRVKGADCRAVAAAAYLGVGSVWALGLSSSAALIMAAPASLPDSILAISGVIPLRSTLGLWQSLLMAGILIVVSMVIAYYSAPSPNHARTLDDMGVPYRPAPPQPTKAEQPGEWLEFSPILSLLICSLGITYFVMEVAAQGPGILLELNHYVFAFLIAGILLHWRPRSFTRSVTAAVPSVAGVLVQYPILCGNRQDDDRIGPGRIPGPIVRDDLDPGHFSGACRCLFGFPWRVCPVGWR
jgi:short-chain fatty acids transporter